MKYSVSLSQPANRFVRRFRYTEANSDGQAIENVLKSLRPGALKRYAARHDKLGAYVTNEKKPHWPNGKPFVVQGYELTLNIS
jgi:hypothetical protein